MDMGNFCSIQRYVEKEVWFGAMCPVKCFVCCAVCVLCAVQCEVHSVESVEEQCETVHSGL